MTTLVTIIAANLLSRVLAIACAAFISFRILGRWGTVMGCAACGLLLSVACTHLIPEAMHMGIDVHAAGIVLMASFLAFAFLDKILGTFAGHSHAPVRTRKVPALLGGGVRVQVESCCSKTPERAAPVLIGSFCHNIVDGVMIAASFASGLVPGLIVTAAVFAHEVPQLVGMTVILEKCGMQRRKAVLWLLAAAMGAVGGGACGWLVFDAVEWLMPYAMVVSAASFIFVVVGVLLPEFVTFGEGARDAAAKIAAVLAGCVFSMCVLAPLHDHAHEAAPGHVHEVHHKAGGNDHEQKDAHEHEKAY